MSSVRTYRPKAKSEGCKLCQMCRYICPDLAITKDEKSKAMRIDLEYCKGCGLCAAFCPDKVIEMVRENSEEKGTGERGER